MMDGPESFVTATELAYVGHNSWDAAYAVDELYSWMFSQKKVAKAGQER